MRFGIFAALLALLPQAAHAVPLTATRVVVLDAGHEPEEGIIRSGTVSEKEFCLKIATALKEIIERENGETVTALILSPADKEPRQREKSATANQARGELYLTIHAVPAGTGQTRGLGIYLPDPADAPARSWRSSARNFKGSNQRLGENLKVALQAIYPQNRVFVAPAPLYLFHGINMPAAAIEVAIDGAAVTTPSFFEQAAQAFYNAIAEFEKK